MRPESLMATAAVVGPMIESPGGPTSAAATPISQRVPRSQTVGPLHERPTSTPLSFTELDAELIRLGSGGSRSRVTTSVSGAPPGCAGSAQAMQTPQDTVAINSDRIIGC